MGKTPSLKDCKPGFEPVEYNVLVAPEEVEDAREIKRHDGTSTKLFMPDQTKETEELATVVGLLVSVSPMAFQFTDWPLDQEAKKPKPGDEVIFAKYAGILHKGADGREYRALKDKDIIAVIR